MKNQIIINVEYFLQCAGSCAGCFLSNEERNSSNVNHQAIAPILKDMVNMFVSENRGNDFFVIGFGRGNNLQLKNEELQLLGEFIKELEAVIKSDEIVFEVSTSLIGKIDTQIEKAKLLLSYSKNIYFNAVVNSEITSKQFWKNIKKFHKELTLYREKLGFIDKTGDILVLNINPAILPSLDDIREFKDGISSPINISIFPFDNNCVSVSENHMLNLASWTKGISEILRDSDFNIKNQLSLIDFEIPSLKYAMEHIQRTRNTYLFIDKNGIVSSGQPSIMGEVDYPRLLEKYHLNIDPKIAFSKMQKETPCINCKYQKECLITGAYFNMLANIKKVKKTAQCPSGYKEFFESYLKK